ncbi:DUF3040 domain-containing protein [Thermobifida halotolerans]|uniref:DUF3040 domain-containing protein n=1 Tax=Thermobifida halotolerans TaxID=483545 RepID=A0A399G947_9ACTN|nr:DUF3040 domain-containing protein [Thermobifida halotolerans]UOE20213.1 DUF3040 domain-containing protein [Thermobifida halotolerans]
MPLSEHEQRMLEQIERALYAEDPKFANTVRQTNPQVHYKRRLVKASIGFVVGIGLLLGGMVFQTVLVSVVGFIIMLVCALWGLSGWRRAAGGGSVKADKGSKQRRQRPGVMDRFEERWRRRQEGDQ